jgi:endonuclease/exonuclease/phosphatase family metal-dependent hydrolase
MGKVCYGENLKDEKMIFKNLLFKTLALIFSLNLSAQSIQKENPIIRILTFNILHGATTQGDFDLDKIAAVIQQTNPDLVALQEVDFKTNRAKNYDLATELGWRNKMAPLFGKAMDYDGGAYGEGILTKMPIVASRNIPLPHSPGNEPRAALEVMVELESGDTICFIGTHLEHQRGSTDRTDQVNKINRVFLQNKYPTILAGDLNDTPESETISILKTHWKDSAGEDTGFTYPSDNPRIKIDYILFRPENRWKVLDYQVICDSIASDHCAVLSVLEIVL